MTLNELLVGINEHQDIAVENLEGARRDAVALHALFPDSVRDLQGHLLVDARQPSVW